MNTSLTTLDGFPRADLDVAQGTHFAPSASKQELPDAAPVRTTRARIIHLRNDHKALMSRIEAGLHAAHAAAKNSPSEPDAAAEHARASGAGGSASAASSAPRPGAGGSGEAEVDDFAAPAFARVNSVVARSPADEAGLQAGDEVRRFGDVDWTNHEKLAKVASLVQRSEGVSGNVFFFSCSQCALVEMLTCVLQRSVTVKVTRKREDGSMEERELRLVPRSNWGGRGMLGCHLLAA